MIKFDLKQGMLNKKKYTSKELMVKAFYQKIYDKYFKKEEALLDYYIPSQEKSPFYYDLEYKNDKYHIQIYFQHILISRGVAMTTISHIRIYFEKKENRLDSYFIENEYDEKFIQDTETIQAIMNSFEESIIVLKEEILKLEAVIEEENKKVQKIIDEI